MVSPVRSTLLVKIVSGLSRGESSSPARRRLQTWLPAEREEIPAGQLEGVGVEAELDPRELLLAREEDGLPGRRDHPARAGPDLEAESATPARGGVVDGPAHLVDGLSDVLPVAHRVGAGRLRRLRLPGDRGRGPGGGCHERDGGERREAEPAHGTTLVKDIEPGARPGSSQEGCSITWRPTACRTPGQPAASGRSSRFRSWVRSSHRRTWCPRSWRFGIPQSR